MQTSRFRARIRLGKLPALIFLMVLASPIYAEDLISCDDIMVEFGRRVAMSNDQLKALYEKANDESDCPRNKIEPIGDHIARQEISDIESALASDKASIDYYSLEKRLTELLYYSSHWKLSFLLGEVYRQTSRVSKAFKSFSEALAALDDPIVTPEEPANDEIALVRRRLNEVSVIYQQMASRVSEVKLVMTRSGEPISIYSFSTRGYKVRETPIPIKFDYDSDKITAVGKETFKQVFAVLKKQNFPSLTIVGHTDSKGSDAYNMNLSLRRAKAVKAILEESGYQGTVLTSGRGETSPFKFDDASLYSKEQRMAADRRVEFKLN